MSKTIVLFGLHGSLIDLTQAKEDSLKTVLQDEIKADIKREIKEAVTSGFSQLLEEKYLKSIKNYWKLLDSALESKTDFEDFSFLNQQKGSFRFAVLSSFPNQLLFKILDKLNCLDCCEMILGGDDLTLGPPDGSSFKPFQDYFGEKPIHYLHTEPNRLFNARVQGLKTQNMMGSQRIKDYLLNPK